MANETQPNTEPTAVITILAERIANIGLFDELQDSVEEIAGDMENSQKDRDRAGMEPGDEIESPILLGIVVAMEGEAHIIWAPCIDEMNPVIAADFTMDVLSEATTAYSRAVATLTSANKKRPRLDFENACPACGPTCEC
jgi:hypothetical protein